MRRDPAWHSLVATPSCRRASWSRSMFVTLAFVFPDDGPLHDWAGLIQRITILAVLFPCRIILATRLLTVAGDQRRRG